MNAWRPRRPATAVPAPGETVAGMRAVLLGAAQVVDQVGHCQGQGQDLTGRLSVLSAMHVVADGDWFAAEAAAQLLEHWLQQEHTTPALCPRHGRPLFLLRYALVGTLTCEWPSPCLNAAELDLVPGQRLQLRTDRPAGRTWVDLVGAPVSISRWEDAPERTQEQVVGTLRALAAALRPAPPAMTSTHSLAARAC